MKRQKTKAKGKAQPNKGKRVSFNNNNNNNNKGSTSSSSWSLQNKNRSKNHFGRGHGGREREREGEEDQTLKHGTSEWKLLQEVLSWDYLNLLTRQAGGKAKASGAERLPFEKRLREVPVAFDDVDHFEDVYEPLLLEECKAVLLRGWTDPGYLLYEARVAEAKGMEGDLNFIAAKLKLVGDNLAKGREVLTVPREEDKVYDSFMEKDIVLLTRENPDPDSNPGSKAHQKTYFLAYLLRKYEQSRSDVLELVVLAEGHRKKAAVDGSRSERVREELMGGGQAMVDLEEEEGERWWVSRIENMLSLLREHKAIFRLRGHPWEDLIIDPTGRRSMRPVVSESKPSRARKVPERLCTALGGTQNEKQVEVLRTSLDQSKVMLVQGPPGTGKTTTLCGLLSVLCHSHEYDFEKSFTKITLEDRPTKQEARRKFLLASPWMKQCDPRKLYPETDPPTYRVPQNPRLVLQKDARRPPRVLVCTPSNSALDEIALRIKKDGLVHFSGLRFEPSMVRTGVKRQVNNGVMDIYLPTLARERIGVKPKGKQDAEDWARFQKEEVAVLKDAQIVFSTLNYANNKIFQRSGVEFDYIVVDEAAQAVEPSCLIPLTCVGCKKFFMVGDPAQLPATVISQASHKYKYNRSLFNRFQLCKYPIHLLETQYRMHPSITRWPSKQFYQGQLVDAPNLEKSLAREWHDFPGFGPFSFYDVKSKSSKEFTSFVNDGQAEFAVAFLETLVAKFPDFSERPSVGIIATYQAMIPVVKAKLLSKFDEDFANSVEVLTVDSYQGREKDIILWTTVRTEGGNNLGFIRDRNRMNVALTRAKSTLIVIGDKAALRKNELWEDLIKESEKRGEMFDAREPFVRSLENQLEKKKMPNKKRQKV